MRKLYHIIAFTLLIILFGSFLNRDEISKEERLAWFQDAKLGIFIHWGIYSVNGIAESWSFYNEHISHKDYMKQLQGFDAKNYDPEYWAKLIKESGARYTVITSKHHDGVALWNSEVLDLSIPKKTPAARDVLTPFVEAAREQGLKIGLYYSLIDWSYPDYPNFTRNKKRYTDDSVRWAKFVQYNMTQIKEISRFKPDLYWFDGGWEQSAERWKSAEIRKMILENNPRAIINSRLRDNGDYATPEQGLPIEQPENPYWELCMTMNDSWGYQPQDTNYKSTNQIIRIFADVLHNGGNLLLDIGPKADGSIPEEQVQILKELGRWTKKHAEAIYGSRAGIDPHYYYGYSTLSADKKTLFLFINGKPSGSVLVKGLNNKVLKATILGSNKALNFRVVGKMSWSKVPGLLYIDIPDNLLDKDMSVVALHLDGPINLYKREHQ
jgi:alpha-L-fucosidase